MYMYARTHKAHAESLLVPPMPLLKGGLMRPLQLPTYQLHHNHKPTLKCSEDHLAGSVSSREA